MLGTMPSRSRTWMVDGMLSTGPPVRAHGRWRHAKHGTLLFVRMDGGGMLSAGPLLFTHMDGRRDAKHGTLPFTHMDGGRDAKHGTPSVHTHGRWAGC